METNELIKVSPSAFCVNGNIVWVVHASLNLFFSYDLLTGNTKAYSMAPYGELHKESQFCGVHAYKNKVYIIPCYSYQVLCFDCTEENITVVEEKAVYGRFARSYIKGKYLYCVPFRDDSFLKIDMDTNETDYITWRNIRGNKDEYINSAFEYNNMIVGTISREDGVLVLENDRVRYVPTNTENEVFSTGCVFDNKIFMYSKSTKRVFGFKNLLDKPIEVFPMIDGGGSICSIGSKYLVMDNIEQTGSLWIDKNRERRVFSEKRMAINGIDYSYNHGLVASSGERHYYYNRRKNILYEYKNDEVVNSYSICFSKKMAEEVFINLMNKQKFISENDVFSLGEFIGLAL